MVDVGLIVLLLVSQVETSVLLWGSKPSRLYSEGSVYVCVCLCTLQE